MNTIDLSPLYRNSVGFDRMASLLDSALAADTVTSDYPPYNIEIHDENRYSISVAVAGFTQNELDVSVENGVLTVRGQKANEEVEEHQYLHQSIANRTFERKFSLAEYVEVMNADLSDGLLSISLVKEIPEAMKPKNIEIHQKDNVIEHLSEENSSDEHLSKKTG